MSQSTPPPHEPQTAGSHYQPATSIVLIIVALFVGATFLMLRYTGPANSNPGVTTLPTTTTIPVHTTTTIPAKAKVRVQVANGTLTTGLARTYTQQLLTLGWDTLPQVNAARVTATIVYFNPGFAWAAQQIAGELKVSSSAVRPLTGVPVPGAASDDVIVILGPDVAQG